MVSIWWVVSAFLMGGFAGLLAFSLIGMAHKESERALRARTSKAGKNLASGSDGLHRSQPADKIGQSFLLVARKRIGSAW